MPSQGHSENPSLAHVALVSPTDQLPATGIVYSSVAAFCTLSCITHAIDTPMTGLLRNVCGWQDRPALCEPLAGLLIC